MKNILLPLFIVLFFVGCSTYGIREDLDKSLHAYNESLLWHEFDTAVMFAKESIVKEFMSRAKAAKEVLVTDYRIVSTRYNAENRTASVQVEIDYYTFSSPRVRTVHDTEEWAYVAENGKEGWRLLSLFPQFK